LKESFWFEVLLSGGRQSTFYNLIFKTMKNSTKLYSGLFAIAIVAITIATTTSASAYRGDPSVKGPDYSVERHEAMTQAFETNDYEAWKELMNGKGRVTQVINADNFARFAEAHELAEEGKLEESKAIRAELGLGLRDGSGQGQGLGTNGQGKGFGRGNQSGARDGSGARGGTNR
jgi:hypothetical protein